MKNWFKKRKEKRLYDLNSYIDQSTVKIEVIVCLPKEQICEIIDTRNKYIIDNVIYESRKKGCSEFFKEIMEKDDEILLSLTLYKQ